jgi:hypothetical protein
VTATPEQDAQAAAAQAAGEAAARQHEAAALAQHQASGSAMVAEDARTPDAVAVSWSAADDTAQPTLVPSSPTPVGQYEIHPPPDRP